MKTNALTEVDYLKVYEVKERGKSLFKNQTFRHL